MTQRRLSTRARVIVLLLCASTVGVQRSPLNNPSQSEQRHVIAGRVIDPHRRHLEDAVLMLERQKNTALSRSPVSVAADGAFVTPPLSSGMYILQVVRNRFSTTEPERAVSFNIVTVGTADVSGVTVEIGRDTALTGRFRMESDNPRAEWPPEITVSAFLALDGMPMLPGPGADGAPEGRFVLRNAFGPRILRCGYSLAPGSHWWPSQVILDGVDITNVPTDFSAHENGRLEVVFTQHPARIAGTVVDADGQPVRAPWILVVSVDRALWQEWATTSTITLGNTTGRFSVVVPPGKYLVRAVPQDTFDSYRPSRQHIQLASEGVPVDVDARKEATVTLTVKAS